ncbi:hypothetical protein AVEN_121926-1 [Araneus ventricosus]|uniref:Uncharacterized protein n=1 Tax=Araneus ventricosus TaxID=182803 RepID=A0A4Y2P905_ARAVE|nr:hypothetical protein AVEN_121926-1 [Araneus ventricosus]
MLQHTTFSSLQPPRRSAGLVRLCCTTPPLLPLHALSPAGWAGRGGLWCTTPPLLPLQPSRMGCHKYVCHHNSFNKVPSSQNKRGISKNSNCPATITIKVKLDTKIIRKRDEYAMVS